MYINFSPINFHYKTDQIAGKQQNAKYPNLALLARDTISFGAMKKTMFDGIDLAVIQKFSSPIEKFNSNEDLQNWAAKKAKAIANKDFGGRNGETKIQRKAMIKEWANYVLKENDAYKKTTALLILSAITKDLDPNNDNLPPVLNRGVLADCIAEIDENIRSDSKYQFNLNKMYRNKLRVFYANDIETDTGETATKWVVIPSRQHDPKNFEANVEKLKTLSYKTWCTKSFNAKPYLADGDFHIYLEDGKPKLGIRFKGDEIKEIQGEKNNGKIPIDYLDIIQKHISENNLSLTKNTQNKIQSARKIKKEIENIKNDLSEAIKSNDIKAIYKYFGIDAEEDKDGYLTISKYKQASENYTFKNLGIDENKLLEKVKTIIGNADFRNSQVTNLSSLETIGGEANFNNSQVTDLSNLKTIGGCVNFRDSQVADLSNLKNIGRTANFSNSQVTDLSSLETIGGWADFRDSKVTDLSNLETIGGNAYFSNSQITDLSNLENIGGEADFSNSQVTNLSNLKTIHGNAYFSNSQVTDLSNLKTIGGKANFRDSQVTNLSNLKNIHGNADFSNSQVTDLSSLETIHGKANFGGSQITDLSNLKTVGGEANFNNSQITDLSNLKTIGGCVNFSNSQVTNLSSLESIGGWAYFRYSQVTDLSNLKTIGGWADFRDSKVTDLSSLKTIGGWADFRDSKVTDLSSLESIGGEADFSNSQVTKIESLRFVMEKIYIKNSLLTVEDFKNVKVVEICYD